ncbi:MAG TPA: phytanoyl-CoA dioxygenase family protein [Candidatus Binataceae bacterium]|nr:phytanoyl-CoA dioxygenase family protein [Candidatus Binataceae bacterium]
MSIEHLTASTGPDRIIAALEQDGVVVIDKLVGTEIMDRIAEELRPWMEATPYGGDEFAGRRTRRTGGLVARSPACRELVMHPLVLSAAGKLLAHAGGLQLHVTQVIAIDPGEPVQQIHRDQWAYNHFPFPKGYQVQCATIWAMSDFTARNGATRVVPGSHLYEDRRHFTEADTVPAEMAKGSVLLYAGNLYHGAGANRSGATRLGITIQYNVSWLRQEENQYLSAPIEIARTLPVELLRLMGYAYGAYSLGYVDDLRDPIDVVRPDLKQARSGRLGG